MGQTIHKDWDINEYATGRFKNGKPIIGALLKNGLNRKKNGIFLPVNTTVFAQNDYEFTHKVDEARAILRFGDSSGNSKKHLFGIEDDEGNWLNVKLDYTGHEMSGVFGNKPTFPHANGLTIEHIPTYNGIKTNYRLGSSGINEITVTFKYNQELTPKQRGNTIVFTRDGRDIFFIKAPFAYDAGKEMGHIEPVAMRLNEIGGFAAATLTVDSLWVAGAIDAVIDPDVTIDDDTGVFEDATLASLFAQRHNNWGGYHTSQFYNGLITQSNNVIMFVDLSAYAGITVVSAKYILECHTKVGATFTMTVNPVLRAWNEGNKSNTTASTGEVTATSARHLQELWTGIMCTGAATDYNITAAASFTTPSSTGSFDVNLTPQSMQDKIDGTNYGDIFRVPLTNTASYILTDSSESSGTKPALYFEYTEEDGVVPSQRGMAGGFNQLTGGMQ